MIMNDYDHNDGDQYLDLHRDHDHNDGDQDDDLDHDGIHETISEVGRSGIINGFVKCEKFQGCENYMAMMTTMILTITGTMVTVVMMMTLAGKALTAQKVQLKGPMLAGLSSI